MTLTRRLSALEASGDATERVVRWLSEAHAYDTVEAYIDHTLAEGPASLPLNRLPREAIAAIKARRGPRSIYVDAEIREQLRGLLFRVHLVNRIFEQSTGVMERQELIHVAMSAYLSLALELEANEERPMLPLPTIRDGLMRQVTEMLALQEARERAEARYLAGASSLFPADTRRWDSVLHRIQYTAASADRLVELDGDDTINRERTMPTEERIEAWRADLVEVARIKTLDDLGEDSYDRARRWFGSKRESAAAG